MTLYLKYNIDKQAASKLAVCLVPSVRSDFMPRFEWDVKQLGQIIGQGDGAVQTKRENESAEIVLINSLNHQFSRTFEAGGTPLTSAGSILNHFFGSLRMVVCLILKYTAFKPFTREKSGLY